MSLAYSYGTLSAAIQAWTDINSIDVQLNMADIISKGELRLYHALDLDNLDVSVTTGAINQLTGLVTKPANLIRERSMALCYGPQNSNNPQNNTGAIALLLHFDGGNASSVFTDYSSYVNAITPESAGGGLCVQSTAHAKFGVSSFLSQGTAFGSYCWVQTPYVQNGPLDLAAQANWTVECWVYPVYTSGIDLFSLNGAAAGPTTPTMRAAILPTTNQVQVVVAGGYTITSTGTVTQNAWNHVAVVMNNGTMTIYVNGVQDTSHAQSLLSSTYSTPIFTVGCGPGGQYGGSLAQYAYIDEVRVSDVAQYTASFTPPTSAFTVPPVVANIGSIRFLRRAEDDWLIQYLVDWGTNVAEPRYYGDYSQTQWQIAPVPDQQYVISVRGIYRPTLLGDNPETTNLAGIAASQHTTASTALTLTTSPFVFANASPSLPSSQLWLYSSGNMAANTFTIVGLDDDGSALTETMAGPSGGTVTSVGVYSQITSITPSITDGTNSVSAGWSQDNQTWLSSRFPELLFWYCMEYACQFNKRFTAAQLAEAEIAKLLPVAHMLTRSLKRSDFDGLYSGRQNLAAPGAITLPAPGGST
jgi:hypothetical protein